ncbi:hypothetical protein BV898_06642 [Hypsibius exemplaris]|uniref:Uncharacterized protein n=1 Tax=Hypsibius exemplaris TaxID=2072580 RepID=A0A1W0WW31_HYPEX|nr:hypothetical protein BV898_06642 [Hypsibius exemplaris]
MASTTAKACYGEVGTDQLCEVSVCCTSFPAPGDPTCKRRNSVWALVCATVIGLQLAGLSGSYWGYYAIANNGLRAESGNFGLWRVCASLRLYKPVWDCRLGFGDAEARLQLSVWSAVSVVCSVISTAVFVLYFQVFLLNLCKVKYYGKSKWFSARRELSQKTVLAVFIAGSFSTACLGFAVISMNLIASPAFFNLYGPHFWIQAGTTCFIWLVLIAASVESTWRRLSEKIVDRQVALEESKLRLRENEFRLEEQRQRDQMIIRKLELELEKQKLDLRQQLHKQIPAKSPLAQ